jgi:predicted lipoprotein with Yx(FWY)xxD motif
MRLLTALIALGAAAALAVGCSDDATGEPAATTAAKGKPGAKAQRGLRVEVVKSQFGRVISDRKGEAFYLFDKETGPTAECYGECARVWPPVLTKGKPVAGKGVRRGLLGTTKRAGGRLQVTYGGQPLYYYVHDEPGHILCHDVPEFGGLWLVVQPSGKPA